MLSKQLSNSCVEINAHALILQQQDALAGLFGSERPADPGESVPEWTRPPRPETPENEQGEWLWDGSEWVHFDWTPPRRLHGHGVLPTGRQRSAREEKLNGAGSGLFVPWWKLDQQLEGIERRRGRASQWDEGKCARRVMEDVRAQTLRAGDLRRWDLPAWISDFRFKLTPTERSVVGALVHCFGRASGGLYDSEVAIAERLGVTERTIRNALWGRPGRPGLVLRGFVRVMQTWSPGTEGRPSNHSWLLLRIGPTLEPMVTMSVYERPKAPRPPRGSGITRVLARKYMALVRRYAKSELYKRTREAWEARRIYEARTQAKREARERLESMVGGTPATTPVEEREPGAASEHAEAPVGAVPGRETSVAPDAADSGGHRVRAQRSSRETGPSSPEKREQVFSRPPNSASQAPVAPSPKAEKVADNTAPVGGGGSYRTPPPNNGRLRAHASGERSSCGKPTPTPQKSKVRPLPRPLPKQHDATPSPSNPFSAWIQLQTAPKGIDGALREVGFGEGLGVDVSLRDREPGRLPEGTSARLFDELVDPYAEQRRRLASSGPASSASSNRRRPDTSVTEAAIAKLRERRDSRSRSLERTITGVLKHNPELGSVLGEFLNSAPALADKSKVRAQPANAFESRPAEADRLVDDEAEDLMGGHVGATRVADRGEPQ